MNPNNYYQKITLLFLACIFRSALAYQGNEFSVHINGTHIELLSADTECTKPEEQNALNLHLVSALYSKGKHCRYQISDIHSITSHNEEPVYFEDHSGRHLKEYTTVFYFHSASAPAEFLTPSKPKITYSKGVYCHSQFEPSLKSFLTSCVPESPEILTGVIRYEDEIWLQPPGECLTEDNHQGFMVTLQPATITAGSTKLMTSTTLAEALSHVRAASVVMGLDPIDLDLPKGIKNSHLINTNHFVQINGLFSCCFSCFRPRTQNPSRSSIIIRRWSERTGHCSSTGADGDLSRQSSIRSTTSSIVTTPQHRPPIPGSTPPEPPADSSSYLHSSPL